MAEFQDILGILTQGSLKDDDGYTVVLPGEASRRSPDLPRYASTQVIVELNNENDLRSMLQVIEDSDRRLAAVTDAEILADTVNPYDWQKVSVRGLSLKFGVMWYDKDYFEARKEAYKSDLHASILKKLNLTAEDLQVTHTILDAA